MSYLLEYREAIRKGEISAGEEMIMELDNLIEDLDDPQYKYDTAKANLHIYFIEHCVRLTKSPFYGKPMILELWEKALIESSYSFKIKSLDTGEWVDRFQEVLLLIARKNGKALAIDTPVLTVNGLKTIGDIVVGDYVYGANGKPVRVTYTSELFIGHNCYEMGFEDGEKIVADADHIWNVQTKNSRRVQGHECKTNRKPFAKLRNDENGYFNITTKEIVNDYKYVRKDGKGIEYKYRVPIPKAIEYKENNNLPIPPYTFGVWLGDGKSSCNYIYGGYDDLCKIITNIENEGVKCDNLRKEKQAYFIKFGNRSLLSKNNLLGNKHIPKCYFNSSIQQRYDLLQGLMDTDGTVSKNGQCEFVQKSEIITNDMSMLLTSLGIKHNVHQKTATCNGKKLTVFRITFFVDKKHTCFKLERKTERLKERLSGRMKNKSIISVRKVNSVPTKCIKVDNENGLFVCGNKNTVTHNTELIAALQLAEMILGRAGSDIICSGTNDNIADLCYQAIDTMRLQIDPDNKDTWKNNKGIKCFANNNKIFKLSESSRGKEGRNIDWAGIDELHELKDDGIYKPIQQSTSTKPDFKIFMFSSEGFINDGFLDKKLKDYRDIIYKRDKRDSSKRKLPWLYTQDSEAEVWATNEDGINKAWQKSNPSVGVVKTWTYLRDNVDEARNSKSDRMFVLSKDFNFKVSNSTAWLDKSDYDYIAEFDIEDFRNYMCLGAVDLSETTDMTNAKILLIKKDDRRKYILSHYWIPESKLTESDDKSAGAKYQEWAEQGLLTICEGNDIDLSLVADWFYEQQEKYGITLLKCGYDQRFKRDWVAKMEYYGLRDKEELIMILQSRDILHTPNRQVEADLKGRLIIGLNEIDKWCLSNAALNVDNRGKSLVVKIDNQSSKRIDGAVCLVIGYETLNRYKVELNDYI